MGENRRAAAGIVVLVVLLAAFAVWRAERPVPTPEGDDQPVGAVRPTPQQAASNDDAASAPRVAAGGTPPVSPAATSAATPAPRGTESADVLNGPQVVALGQRAAQEYRRLAQYPPWSRPFTDEGEDPILRDRLVSPITATGEDGAEPTLVVFPQQTSFEAPEPVLLYAYLSVNGSRVAANAIGGTLLTEDLQPLAQLAYNDDGSDGDPIAGDQIYTARFDPGPDFAPDLSESFLVRVSAETTAGEPRSAATSFLYSNPHARLTGNYRDAIVNGSLVIDAEVEVFRPGRFHLEGTLYSQDGRRGIGEAHTAGELPTGRQWMRLTFFGRIIAQSGIDGPYLLRFLALSTTTAMPNAKNRLVENAHVTGAYRSAQFSDAPFDDPDLRDAADRLERDLQPPGS